MKSVVRLIAAMFIIPRVQPVPLQASTLRLEKITDSRSVLSAMKISRREKSFIRLSPWGVQAVTKYRVNKDVTRIKLITTTQVALCITCHADKNATR